MTTLEHHTHRVAAALAATRAAVREENRAAWAVQTPSLHHAVHVRIADDWLLFEAPLDAARHGVADSGIFVPEQLVQWNATLPGGAKFGLDSRFNLAVRADVPLIEDVDPGPRLLEAWNGIEAGLARFHTRPEPTTAPSRAAEMDLKTAAGETGWTFAGREDGRIVFEMPSPAGVLSATFHARDEGGGRVGVPLADLSELATPSRHALAVLLLRTGSTLRLARPAFAAGREPTSACLEVVFDSAPITAELTQALESLAVGVALVATEARLLCEEQTAREYLTVGTWSPREQENNNNQQ